MKKSVKTLVLLTISFLLFSPADAQIKLPFVSNGVGSDVKKVIEDYPNRFINLMGEVKMLNEQSTDYYCNFKVNGAEETFVTRYSAKREPEKIFLQPLARAAIEIRRHILAERRPYRRGPGVQQRTQPAGDILLGDERIEVRDYDSRPALQRAPEGIQGAARLIDALTMEPRDRYFRDLAVYFGLRTARSQLAVARNPDEAAIAADTLWRTALRAEYGGAADARRALEEAQRQLAEALAHGAPQERIRQLLEALRRATENYMQALVQEALRNGEAPENLEDTEDQATLSERDIQNMLRRVQ